MIGTVLSARAGEEPSSSPSKLDHDGIQRAIRKKIPKVMKCYENSPDYKKIAGKMVVHFEVSAGGKVEKTSMKQSLQPEIDSCVQEVLKSLEFAPSETGQKTQVDYPFVFRVTLSPGL